MKKLQSYFDFEKDTFYGPVELQGVENGFNVQKKIGAPGFVSYFRIYINPDIDVRATKKAISIQVTNGKQNNDNSLTISSSDWKRPFFGPIDIISEDEFYFDTEKEIFYKKDKEISPQQLLKEIEKSHIKTTKFISGMW